jgi:hypothetical protein
MIPFVLVCALAVLGLACQKTADSAGEAGAALSEEAAEMGAAAGEAVEETGAAAAEGTAEMLQQAEAAVGELGDEAKASYEAIASKVAEKQDELKEIQQKLAGMAPQDLLSGEGKDLKEQAETLTGELADLKKELQGIIDQAR